MLFKDKKILLNIASKAQLDFAFLKILKKKIKKR